MKKNSGSEKYEYIYDANGNLETQLYYKNATAIADNKPSNKSEYVYDSNGIMESKTEYNCTTSGCTSKKIYTEYTYDSNGNMTSWKGYGCKGGRCKNVNESADNITYDEHGNKLKYYEGGTLRESYIYDPAFLYNQWLANRKLRYTIPEADELTTNDNNNWVEWTFE